ncbi:MAG: aconitase/3-isopropylmalate dehydratase large subunit family protein [Candidatus Aminicenantes bacterium]|jgi:homoaconitate hydratase family protein/3-isopropylmalate dehydratase small subunit
MGQTIIEKIFSVHCGQKVRPGDIVDITVDTRIARDFGGANVVKNLEESGLGIENPDKTFFTFDCNPGGSSQKYATNQQLCRNFARKHGIKIYDINAGIGTHIAIDEGLVCPGETLVSTDSHANLVGAIGAFGQGMGDVDIAHAFAKGKVWFKVPPTVKLILKGNPSSSAHPKDIVLFVLKTLGSSGLLGSAAEIYGDYADNLGLSGRITTASMTTEMGGICCFFPPNREVIDYCTRVSRHSFTPVYADSDAAYEKKEEIDIEKVRPMVSLPGHPEDAVPVDKVRGKKIDSIFIGSCTDGRYEDLLAAAKILDRKKVAPGVVLKIVPSTDRIWQQALKDGLITSFKNAGALLGNAGCAGCAEGQIGQNGPGEVTVSTGNRNFAGKQGKGDVFLASPATAAASAVAGLITTADKIPEKPSPFRTRVKHPQRKTKAKAHRLAAQKPTTLRGRVWVVCQDNIDTDMIFHNRHLTVTDVKEMGQYTFGNLGGWEDFPQKAQPGDIVVIAGENFGCGSSRQQAVDCFKSLGVSLIIAKSFGAIYERNAINSGFPVLTARDIDKLNLTDGDRVDVDLTSGRIINLSNRMEIFGSPFSVTQLNIYHREGLLK